MDVERETDPLDIAAALETRDRDACVEAARNHPAMRATGFCYDPACRNKLPVGHLFCGEECRDFYVKMQRMNRIQGKT